MRANGYKNSLVPFLQQSGDIIDPLVEAQIYPFRQDVVDLRCTTAYGRRYSGTPTRIIPPGTGKASNTVTACPLRTRSSAQVSPAGPAPTTATRLPESGRCCAGTGCQVSELRAARWPNRLKPLERHDI